ncbi:hypothetical protein FXO37_20083 [Capsicum annuum]|nr:hypothetical protein FXO37_20083 [Capsicum annuum]
MSAVGVRDAVIMRNSPKNDMADPLWDVAILRDAMRELQKEVHDLHWELTAVTRGIQLERGITRVGFKLENIGCLRDRGTMAAHNFNATCDRINDNIEDIKRHIEIIRQLLPKLYPQNPIVQAPCIESLPEEVAAQFVSKSCPPLEDMRDVINESQVSEGFKDVGQGKRSEPMSLCCCKDANVCLGHRVNHVLDISFKLDNDFLESESSKSICGLDYSLFRHNVLFEDSLFTPNEPSGESDVDGMACLGSYILYANPLWCDNIPPRDGNLFLEDESTLKGRECVVLKRNSQSGEDDHDFLDYLGNPKYDCSCKNVFVNDSFAAHGDLYLCGDYSLEIKGGACLLEIPSTSSLCVPYVENTSVDGLEASEYMHKDTIAEVSLCDTFTYPLCAHNISTNDLEGMPNFDDDTLGESESGLDPCPWLLLPFDPGTILGYGMDLRSNTFQEGEDDMGEKTTNLKLVTTKFNLSVESLMLDSSLETLDAWEIEVTLVLTVTVFALKMESENPAPNSAADQLPEAESLPDGFVGDSSSTDPMAPNTPQPEQEKLADYKEENLVDPELNAYEDCDDSHANVKCLNMENSGGDPTQNISAIKETSLPESVENKKTPMAEHCDQGFQLECRITRVGFKLENVGCLGDRGPSCATILYAIPISTHILTLPLKLVHRNLCTKLVMDVIKTRMGEGLGEDICKRTDKDCSGRLENLN